MEKDSLATQPDPLDKVHEALSGIGLSEAETIDVVHAVLSAGIYFVYVPPIKPKPRREYIFFIISVLAVAAIFIFDGLLGGDWQRDLYTVVFVVGFCYIWDRRSVFTSRNK